jgi:hypothetical protein
LRANGLNQKEKSGVLMFTIISVRSHLRGIVIAACIAVYAASVMPRAAASESDKKTVVTFNTPVEIPGKALPAGAYVFKLLDSTADRNIVQIFDKDEKQLYATILALPNYRLEPAEKPIVQFEERPSDSPPAIAALFYPGDNYGLQFVYTQDRAAQLAKRTHQNVLSMRNGMDQNIKTPADSSKAESVQALENTKVTAMSPSGRQVGTDQAISSKPTNSH